MARLIKRHNGSSPLAPVRPETAPDAVLCPRCGRYLAKVIGRSAVVPVVYLHCDGCGRPAIAAS